MLSVAIVEDEETAISNLKECFKMYEEKMGESIRTVVFNNAEQFLAEYNSVYNVIFLDIEFNGRIDGISAAHKLRTIDNDVKLIFVTNMAQFAIKGYEVNALDYIVKPVSYHKIKMLLDRIINMQPRSGLMLKINIDRGIKTISSDDIYYIEINDHVLKYHTKEGVFENRGSNLKELEKQLSPACFARCNICYLVNLKHCDELSNDFVRVGGDRLKISRSRQHEFKRKLIKVFGE